ncbi:MAG: hypothetical protein JW821_17330 [Deltaproteobacteria bacterium]|nr:hypothetical protein [Deltaproteobacteria bacterium]
MGEYNGTVFGHEFDFSTIISLKKVKVFKKGKHWLDVPTLEWREDIHWWEPTGGIGTGDDLVWHYRGNTPVDMFALAPGSKTMFSWNWQATLNDHPRWLKMDYDIRDNRVKPKVGLDKWQTMSDEEKAFKLAEYYADHNVEFDNKTTDRPGMMKEGGSGKGGGGLPTLANGRSRRRIINFNIGFRGVRYSQRVTCTQILETQDGVPTISKFIIPGLTQDEVIRIGDDYYRYWRSRLNPMNVSDQTFDLEDRSTVDEWLRWTRTLTSRGLI